MPEHPTFKGRPISDDEHAVCVEAFGAGYIEFVVPLTEGDDLFLRGRLENGGGEPCIYVFRSKELYDEGQQGLCMHIQRTETPGSIQIVFHRLRPSMFSGLNGIYNLVPDRLQPDVEEWHGFVVDGPKTLDLAYELFEYSVCEYDESFQSLNPEEAVPSEEITADFELVCPTCQSNDSQINFYAEWDGSYHAQCNSCKNDYSNLSVIIRAKRSRKERDTEFSSYRRHYTVRALKSLSEEELLEFTLSNGEYDIELRARDQVIFAYDASKNLVGIENRTVRKYNSVQEYDPSRSSCYIATCVYGVAAAETVALRSYRDKVLLQTAWGRMTNKAYLCISPLVVLLFGNNAVFRKLMLLLLRPLVRRRMK